jgi:hypothetical protein
MSDPVSASPYDDDWLPDEFKPMSFTQLVWHKLKGAPIVGVGESLEVLLRCQLTGYRSGSDCLLSCSGIVLHEDRQFFQIQRMASIPCSVSYQAMRG